jgi:hypothetical protein
MFVLQDRWLSVSYPKVPGSRVVIDVVHESWDDAQGDPEKDAMRYLAWTLGALGGYCHPGGFGRAIRPGGGRRRDWGHIQEHAGYVRVRLLMPVGDERADAGRDVRDLHGELEFMSWLVVTLLDLPGTMTYFNPAAEILMDREAMARHLERVNSRDRHPMPLWVNRREIELGSGWRLVDTLGNGQLGLPDLGAFFKGERSATMLLDFINEMSHHMYASGQRLGDDDTVSDTLGHVWRVSKHEASLGAPARPVVTLKLVGSNDAPDVDQFRDQRYAGVEG